jgi:hypothetical protein
MRAERKGKEQNSALAAAGAPFLSRVFGGQSPCPERLKRVEGAGSLTLGGIGLTFANIQARSVPLPNIHRQITRSAEPAKRFPYHN